MIRYLLIIAAAIAPISKGCHKTLYAQAPQQQAMIAEIKSKLDALSANIEANKPTTPPPVTPPPANAQPTLTTPITGKTWTLSFADEFSGTKLDTAKWNYLPHWGTSVVNGGLGDTIGNGGQLEFTGSIMRLRADRQSNGRWRTSVITTMGKQFQTYGFFEARLKLPRGSGMWPGWWLMREDKVWPDGEVDMLESNGYWPKLYAPNFHWVDSSGTHRSQALYYQGNGDLGADFHVYGCHWQAGRFDFYLDGKLIHTVANQYVTKVPMYILLSLEISNGGSTWPAPNSNNPSPAFYDVDYIRAWK